MSLKGSILALSAAVLVASAVVLLVSASFGRDSSTGRPDATGTLHPLLERPDAFAAARSGVRVRYLESDKETVGPGATAGFSFKCPKKTPRAIGGYGGPTDPASQGQVVLSDSIPFKGGRNWSVGVRNLSDQPRTFYVGVVCVG
jgi:hypothetical protein